MNDSKKVAKKGKAKGGAKGASADAPTRIEATRLDSIEPLARNAKAHDVPKIVRSFRRFGFVAPPTIDEKTGTLAAGHGRVKALERMRKGGEKPPARIDVAADGMWMVPVLRGISFANQHELEAYAIADNRLTEVGGWDKEKLTDWLRDGDEDFESIGFSQDDVKKLLGEMSEEMEKEGESDFVFQVLVECSDEDHQAEVLAQLEGEGMKCRPLIS